MKNWRLMLYLDVLWAVWNIPKMFNAGIERECVWSHKVSHYCNLYIYSLYTTDHVAPSCAILCSCQSLCYVTFSSILFKFIMLWLWSGIKYCFDAILGWGLCSSGLNPNTCFHGQNAVLVEIKISFENGIDQASRIQSPLNWLISSTKCHSSCDVQITIINN